MVSALPLADGPAYYFGSTIMTFALPYGAFIAVAVALYFVFRARHSGPRLAWSNDNAAQIASVTTREPGPAPAPEVIATSSVAPVAADRLVEAAPDPVEEDALAQTASSVEPAPEQAAPAAETETGKTEGKAGEEG